MVDTTETLPSFEDGAHERLVPYFDVEIADQAPRRFHLTQRSAVVGRDEDADLVLDARGVSRKHARLARGSDGALQVVDLGAKNGTYLNGRRVELAGLRAGDRVRIGVAELVVGFDDLLQVASEEQGSTTDRSTRLRKRELEVAELVAEGLTNAAIAERLSISPRTVSTHLTKIYERLGVKSRAALTRWVVQQRVTEGAR